MCSQTKISTLSFANSATGPVRAIILCLVILIFQFHSPAYSQQPDRVADYLNKFITWRNIGPAIPGGRTVDIDVVEKKPWIIYAAVGPSGLWKSETTVSAGSRSFSVRPRFQWERWL